MAERGRSELMPDKMRLQQIKIHEKLGWHNLSIFGHWRCPAHQWLGSSRAPPRGEAFQARLGRDGGTTCTELRHLRYGHIAVTPAQQIVYVENTPMFVQIANDMGISGLLSTDYHSTWEKLARLGLRLG